MYYIASMQSVKYALLGLLAEEPRHGYDLKGAFEELMGGSWELNIGQVYSTLSRLERDGLVASEVVPQDLVPDRKVYAVTEVGRKELEAWLTEPSDGPVRLKNEVYVKVALLDLLGEGDPDELLAGQRAQYLQRLSELSELADDEGLDGRARLLVEGARLHVEADLRWLDLCEARLTEEGT